MPTRAFFIAALLAGAMARLAPAGPGPDAARPSVPAAPPAVVHVATVDGMIDLGLAPFLQRVLDEAAAEGAAAVVLEINTFGGRVDAAVQMRDALLNSQVRTIAFVNKRAISAGALITLAAQTVVMASGSTIGAATPVQAGQPGTQALPVEEKTVSYVRKEFRATAEARQRPPELAEAMVDADVVIPGVVDKGKLLTLTTDEALRLKVADLRADTLEAALQAAGLGQATIRRHGINWAENLVRFLTHPLVSSLLVTLAMLGILIELRTPGLGVPGAVGIASLGLVLWGHWLVRLAGFEEMLLAAIGVVLLAVEMFVIPGFGIAGVLGALALMAGLVLSLTGEGNTAQLLAGVATRMVVSLVLALAASMVLLRLLVRVPAGRRLLLDTQLDAGAGYASPPPEDARWLGQEGTAASVLRPAGIALIDGHRLDVVSEGELVEAGARIEVIRVDGNRVVVRPVPPPPSGRET